MRFFFWFVCCVDKNQQKSNDHNKGDHPIPGKSILESTTPVVFIDDIITPVLHPCYRICVIHLTIKHRKMHKQQTLNRQVFGLFWGFTLLLIFIAEKRWKLWWRSWHVWECTNSYHPTTNSENLRAEYRTVNIITQKNVNTEKMSNFKRSIYPNGDEF